MLFCATNKGGNHHSIPVASFPQFPAVRTILVSPQMDETVQTRPTSSNSDIQMQSDSDRESDYVTGLEDFVESMGHPEKERGPVKFTSCLEDFSHASSFIQKLLYEDSRAGVAVVDLFVALKQVKESLDSLTKSNNDILAKINLLNKDARLYQLEYKALVGSMHRFLKKMDADADVWYSVAHELQLCSNTSLTLNEEPKPGGEGTTEVENTKVESLEVEEKKERVNCKESTSLSTSETEEKAGCVDCFVSTLKKKSLGRSPVLSEAFMGSFIASLFWLQKGEKTGLEEGKMENLPSLRPSTMQVIYDICEVMKEKAENGLDWPGKTSCTSVPNNTPVENLSCLYCNRNPPGREGSIAAEDTGSDTESMFEEALTGPVTTSDIELRGKPSVTCMGDLTKEAASGRRNEGTLTSAIDVVPSWIRALSAEISSQLKKTKSRTNVKVLQQPHEAALGQIPDSMKFTLSSNTPMGVFDVTVVHYKKRRFLRDNLLNLPTTPLVEDSDPKSLDDLHFTTTPGYNKLREDDYFWSEESIINDATSLDTGSLSGEFVLEEFIEVYVDESKKDETGENDLGDHVIKGSLNVVEMKEVKANFFEIQKCVPVYSIQNQVVKTQIEEAEDRALVSLASGPLLWNSPTGGGSTTGEKRKEFVIEGSSTDLVIFIQIEVEEGESPSGEGLVVEYQTTTLGTQTADGTEIAPYDGRVIRLEPDRAEGESLYHVWKGYELNQLREESEEEWIDEEERVVMVKEPREKTVTFNEQLSEILIEDSKPETATAVIVDMKEVKQHAFVWHLQNNQLPIDRGEVRVEQDKMEDIVETIKENAVELEKALNLIREIENDIVEVKLDDAIAMLPRLEMELRKHLQDKLKVLEKESNGDSSLHNFFSAIDFWPDDRSAGDSTSDNSEERLTNLLRMLSSLEEAVKSNKGSISDLCQYNSSKIYKLLHALTLSIRELEEGPNLTSLSQTLEIASQLDTAVREYDHIIKQEPSEYVKGRWKSDEPEEMPVKHHLKNVRKRVFEMVGEDAVEVEERIERDFDRLDRLERENDEVLTFLETFLQKTERRVTELGDLKVGLKDLSLSLNNMYESLQELVAQEREREKKASQLGIEVRKSRVVEREESRRKMTKEPVEEPVVVPVVEPVVVRVVEPVVELVEEPVEEPVVVELVEELVVEPVVETVEEPKEETVKETVKETVSGLMMALDTLKSRAKEKHQLCLDILQSEPSVKALYSGTSSSPRSSRSSFTSKNPEPLTAVIRDFKKIGDTSLYLSWTKPVGLLEDAIVGYQIYVNDKLNQKVRNPQRLQAILYSVDLSQQLRIQLYALTEKSPKILLGTRNFKDD